MALSLERAGRFFGACRAGLFLLAACAQSPTSDAVPEPSTGATGQTENDASSAINSGDTPTGQDGTSAAAGGSSTGGSTSKPGSTGATTAGTRADAGAAAGAAKDASTGTPSTSGSATSNDAGAPSGGATAIDAGTATSGTSQDASTGSSGGTSKDASTGSSGGTSNDAGTPTSTGGTAHCASTPGYPTADACAQCICAKCGTQVASCYASGDATKDMQCGKVQACAETKHCASTSCYCGSAFLCLPPSGACVDVIQSVAGSTSSTDVLNASNDTSTPIGRANAIGTCSQTSCKSECGL